MDLPLGDKYIYSTLAAIFLLFWLVIFYWRKNIRLEMIIISILGAFLGPMSDYIYFKDWWHPYTFSGSFVSVESMITGFSIGGIAAVIYEVVFNKHLMKRKYVPRSYLKLLIVIIIGFTTFLGLFLILRNSFYTSIITLAILVFYELFRRPDLLKDSFYSGILFLFITALIYAIVDIFIPGWVEKIWYFKNTPKIFIGSLPIDDAFWYFFAGAGIGPLFEYAFGSKLKNNNH